MKLEGQTRAMTAQGMTVPTPLSLGFADLIALALGAALMAVAVLWPSRRTSV
ncbi:MAG: hypothetical protein ACREQY_12285 [Candidatus Binatia bacterium]